MSCETNSAKFETPLYWVSSYWYTKDAAIKIE